MTYQPFPISNFRTGFDQAVEPWLLPRDGFQLMQNAHLYRGVVETIPGYNVFAYMSYRRQVALTGTIDGANKTFTGNLAAAPSTNNFYIQATINSGATTVESFRDDGTGTLTGSNGGTGTVSYTTPFAVSVIFGTDAPVVLPSGGSNIYNTVILEYDTLASEVSPLAIMGIKPYYGISGTQNILIFDQHRMGVIVELMNSMAVLQQKNYGISEVPHQVQAQTISHSPAFNGSATTFTGTLASTNLVPGQVVFTMYVSSASTAALIATITDNGAGLLTGTYPTNSSPMPVTGFINYTTGAWTLTFTTAPASGNTINSSVGVFGDFFTGSISNFFVVDNFGGNAFITNNKDPIMYYNGSQLLYLNTNLTSKPNTIAPYDISICLHLVMHRDRLLLLAPIVLGIPALNAIFWSTALNPLLWTNDERSLAPTSEYIKAFSIINYDLIVRFINSEYVFRYTSDAFLPFRWDKTNSLWRCDAPYSSINYDSYFTSIGLPGIVASDGVNIIRIDENIPDFTLNNRIADQAPIITIDETSIIQCYGERFDDFKEGWLCYKGSDQTQTNVVQKSDAVLAYNYQDETYSIYTFPFSCLGFGRIIDQIVWGNNFDLWGDADYAWNSFSQNNNALIDLAGGFAGEVFELGESYTLGDVDLDDLNPVQIEIISKNFNPFIEDGQLARFGWVDFLVSNSPSTNVRVQFYNNDLMDANFDSYYSEQTLNLNGNGQSKVWKRLYTGAVGKSHTLRIYQNINDFTEDTLDQPVRIHAMVLYFKPAGRIYS